MLSKCSVIIPTLNVGDIPSIFFRNYTRTLGPGPVIVLIFTVSVCGTEWSKKVITVSRDVYLVRYQLLIDILVEV